MSERERFMPENKYFGFAAALLFLFVSFPAQAQNAQALIVEYPNFKTMMVRAGNQSLWIEPPAGMCFVDRTVPLQNLIFESSQSFLKGEAVVLGAFAGCDELNQSRANKTGGLTFFKMGGYIAWLNPTFAPDLKITRDDFLQVFGTMVQEFAKSDYQKSLDAYGETSRWQQKNAALNAFIPGNPVFSEQTWKTPLMVAAGYTAQSEVFGRNWNYSSLIGGTMLRGIPLAINISYTDPQPMELDEVALQMDALTRSLVHRNEYPMDVALTRR